MSSRGRPVEGSCDHRFVIDHGELVMELVAMSEAGVPKVFDCSGFEETAQGCSELP